MSASAQITSIKWYDMMARTLAFFSLFKSLKLVAIREECEVVISPLSLKMMLMLTSTATLFVFRFFIGCSGQFEDLIRKINDFFQCYCVANFPHPVSPLKACSPCLWLISGSVSSLQIDLHLQVPGLWCRSAQSSTHPCCASWNRPEWSIQTAPPPRLSLSEAHEHHWTWAGFGVCRL